MDITTPVTDLKGIGSKTGALFHRVGIDTVGELLSYYPRTYDVYEAPLRLVELDASSGKKQAVTGFVGKRPSTRSAGRLKVSMLTLEEFGDKLQLVWFNMPYIGKRLIPGSTYIFRGYVKKERGRLVMDQPEVFEPPDYEKLPQVMQPVYALTSGLSNKLVSKAVRQALDGIGSLPDPLPDDIRRRQGLIDYDGALHSIHFPQNKETLEAALKRLKFDEFYQYAVAVEESAKRRASLKNDFPITPGEGAARLLASFPFDLTGAQEGAWEEIRTDLAGGRPMRRLLQGDVGSGKTAVALLALTAAADCGYQAALMAPTEVLAKQHFHDIEDSFSGAGIKARVLLLTGSLSARERHEAYMMIESGEADIVVGTHALIQEKVAFKNLALVVVDEQHRFGVRQREELAHKGAAPHMLSMSATPIPRTLAAVIYGDMDLSVIDEMPKDRLPVKNCVVGEDYRPAAWRFIDREVKAGHQAYVVCPMVGDNTELSIQNVEDYSAKLEAALGGVAVGRLHGRMASDEKERIMEEFASGGLKVLVSTTVIEVGINVKNATVMLVEDADRFGLTQLHQLRGRVGRGDAQSYCIFISTTENEATRERLKLLEKSNDGFFIAAEDLRLRGPGDLPGVRQSGLPAFRLGDIFSDQALFMAAAGEARGKIIKS